MYNLAEYIIMYIIHALYLLLKCLTLKPLETIKYSMYVYIIHIHFFNLENYIIYNHVYRIISIIDII